MRRLRRALRGEQLVLPVLAEREARRRLRDLLELRAAPDRSLRGATRRDLRDPLRLRPSISDERRSRRPGRVFETSARRPSGDTFETDDDADTAKVVQNGLDLAGGTHPRRRRRRPRRPRRRSRRARARRWNHPRPPPLRLRSCPRRRRRGRPRRCPAPLLRPRLGRRRRARRPPSRRPRHRPRPASRRRRRNIRPTSRRCNPRHATPRGNSRYVRCSDGW